MQLVGRGVCEEKQRDGYNLERSEILNLASQSSYSLERNPDIYIDFSWGILDLQ